MKILELILNSAQTTFFEVTVFVGAALFIFGYINYRERGKLITKIRKNRKWQPLIGALLGLTPGCGGAILIMPLYMKRSVTFGAVIATLTATIGDSAFVLISKVPIDFIKITVITFVTGVVSGYIIDYFKIGKIGKGRQVRKNLRKHRKFDHKTVCCKQRINHIGHYEGDKIDIDLHHKSKHHQKPGTLGYKLTHEGYKFYWLFIAVGLFFGTLKLFNLIPEMNIIFWIGVLGTIFSIIFMIGGHKYIADDTHEEEELKLMSMKETLIHNAEEVAFVGVWVFVAYLLYDLGAVVFDGDYTQMIAGAGMTTVLAGALIGLIPGCGPQVLFVALYSKGLLPFAALIAHSISQDGDAIFPLLAMNKEAALLATMITTIVGLIVGSAFYLML